MPVITAFAGNEIQGGIDNPHLSADMDGFTADLWPPDSVDIGNRALVAMTRHFPVSQTPRAITTRKATSYFDDFYNRIHINPRILELGNVVSTQTEEVYVWNAHLVARTLNAIDGVEAGMLIEGQPAPPLLFNPNTELTFDVSVTPDGPSVLNAEVTWTFDNGEVPVLIATANRIVGWAFLPDWAEGIIERLEWNTEILASETLVEQRRAHRIAPLRYFEAPLFVEGRERQLLDLTLFDWGARIWAMPLWHEVQILTTAVSLGGLRVDCATDDLDFFVGGLAMLRGPSAFSFEVVEVAAIDANGIDLARPVQQAWPAGTRFYPVRPAQLVREPELTRLTDTAQSLEVEFLVMETSDWPEIAPATLHRGWPVLEIRPDETDDLTSSQARLLATLDNGSALPRITDIAGRAMPLRGWKHITEGRAERAALRSLLYALRGQQVPVWIPTHADDLTVVATISGSATTIDVLYCGYTRFGKAQSGRRDIRIELFGGTAFHRHITGSTAIDADTERLSIDTSLGLEVTPEAIRRVSWMTLSRGSSDRVEIQHLTDSEGIAACSLTFRGVRDDDV